MTNEVRNSLPTDIQLLPFLILPHSQNLMLLGFFKKAIESLSFTTASKTREGERTCLAKVTRVVADLGLLTPKSGHTGRTGPPCTFHPTLQTASSRSGAGGRMGPLTWADCTVELLCQKVLVDGPQDLQGQPHGVLLPIVGDQQSGQLHWLGCLELAPGNPGVLLLQAGVLQLELELLKVIGHQLFQGVQQMVTTGLGHGIDQERLEATVWLLRGEAAVCPGAQRETKKQLVK